MLFQRGKCSNSNKLLYLPRQWKLSMRVITGLLWWSLLGQCWHFSEKYSICTLEQYLYNGQICTWRQIWSNISLIWCFLRFTSWCIILKLSPSEELKLYFLFTCQGQLPVRFSENPIFCRVCTFNTYDMWKF